MTNARTTKKALLMSMLSLLLCFTMLLSTTFAWFTDTVTSANNIITAGNLDVELKYAKIKDGAITGWDTVQGKDNIFDKNALWEPGRVEVVYLEVSNLGSLALKYQLGVNVYKETPGTNVDGEEFYLSNHLVFKVIEMPNGLTTYTDREAVEAVAGTTKGLKDYNGATTPLEVDGIDYVALIVYMPESVGNEANYRGTQVPKIELGINLYATQQTAEEDSFGTDYDEDAWVEGMKAYNAEDLQAALNNGENVKLMNNIELTETLVIPAPAVATYSARNAVVIDLNGKSITGIGRNEDGKVHTLINNGNAVIKNGIVSSTGVNGGSAILNTGVLTLENVTVNGAPSDTATGTASYAVNTEGAGSKLTVINSNISGRGAIGATEGTKVEINGGTFHTPAVAWGHAVYATNDGTEVVINDGTFSEGYEMAANNWGMYQIYSSDKAKVTVNGGTFMEWDCANGYDLCTASEGTIVIYGGTFADNPSKQNKINYVADGFKAVNVNGAYHVVSESADGVIASAADLLALGGKNVEGIYEIVADIDLKGAAMPTIGAAYGKTLTINGNGHTISNATTAHTSHNGMKHHGFFYAYTNSTLNISDITFDNIVIDATKDAERNYGVAIVVAYADGGSTVNLTNVDVKNSKVLNSTPDIGDEAGVYVGYQTGTLNMVDCDSTKCEVAGETAAKTGAFIGMVNGTASLTNCTTDLTIGACNRIGGSLTIDGALVVTTANALQDAVASGDANVYLPTGNYNMPATSGNVVISGDKDTVISGNDTTAKNVTFNGVTIQSTGNAYTGIKHSETVVYNDATIVGNMYLYAQKVVFNNCTFDLSNTSDYVWVYGATNVEFNNCTFNTMGKAILVFQDGSKVNQTVKVEGCVFNASAPAYNWDKTIHISAVSIDGNQGGTYNVILNNNTVDSDFNGLWQDKTAAGNITVTVDDVTVLKP